MLLFEHTLFMLLLLVGLFSARPKYRWISLAVLSAGIALILIAPRVALPVPWEWILALVIPILFWQNNLHWMQAKRFASWQESLLWLATTALIAVSLVFIMRFYWMGAILFGLVATSLFWRFIEPKAQQRLMSQLGVLVLIFLLTEVSLIAETPKRYLGSLFSGAGIGLAMALAGLYLAEKISSKPYPWLGVLQVYAAYALAVGSNSSGVSAALVSVIAFSEGTPKDQKPHMEHLAPLDHWSVYLPFTILFLLLGWQIHIPFSINFIFEGSLGLLLGVLITWLVGKISNQPSRSFVNLLASGLYLGIFLFAALTLWPKHLMQNPRIFFLALVLALFALLLSAVLLRATKEI